MTQAFDEYLAEQGRGNIKCTDCKKFICYGEICDNALILCISCMKEDYEKNKK